MSSTSILDESRGGSVTTVSRWSALRYFGPSLYSIFGGRIPYAGDPGGLLSTFEVARQGVVIFFFPKADTPGSIRESCAFRDLSKKFAKLNAEIVGVSRDKSEAQEKFIAKYDLPYTLAPDPDHAIAEA